MKSHVVICGTGRAGTSFLMVLLSRLGLDTGFRNREAFNPVIRAGMEHSLRDWRRSESWVDMPEIVKAPGMSTMLTRLPVSVRHVIIPVRDLDECVKSRESVDLQWGDRNHLACVLGNAVAGCVSAGLDFTILEFPKHVSDVNYAYEKLSAVFDLEYYHFCDVFERTAAEIAAYRVSV